MISLHLINNNNNNSPLKINNNYRDNNKYLIKMDNNSSNTYHQIKHNLMMEYKIQIIYKIKININNTRVIKIE